MKYKTFEIKRTSRKTQIRGLQKYLWGVYKHGKLYYIGTFTKCVKAIDSGACDMCDWMRE